MKIFNILDSAAHVIPEMTVARLERYSHNVFQTLKPREITVSGSLATIGVHNVETVSRRIKMGYMGDLTHVYEIPSVPKKLEYETLNDVKKLPAYKVGESERFGETVKNKIKEKSRPGQLDHLDRPEGELSLKDLDNSPPLKKLCEFLRGKRLRSLIGTTLVIGGTTALVVSFLNEHRKTLSGCIAFRYVNGVFKGCKIPTCSCVDGSTNTHFSTNYPQCDNSVLSLLDGDMLNPANCAGFKGTGCVQCPSAKLVQNKNKNPNASDEELDVVDPIDLVHFQCLTPTIWEALSDVLDSVGEAAINVIDSASNALSWLATNWKTILFVIAGVFFGILAVWLIRFIGVGRQTATTTTPTTPTSDK